MNLIFKILIGILLLVIVIILIRTIVILKLSGGKSFIQAIKEACCIKGEHKW